MLGDALYLDRPRLLTMLLRFARDVAEHRKPIGVLLRRGLALYRAEPAIRSRSLDSAADRSACGKPCGWSSRGCTLGPRECWNCRDRSRLRIAYQGEPGANSHIVCVQHYPDAEALPCASFEDVFAAVDTGEADLALIPIDNSIAGRVADIHHFLPGSGLHIIAEHFLRIRFHLMGVPGTTLETIKTVHSPRARPRPVPQDHRASTTGAR